MARTPIYDFVLFQFIWLYVSNLLYILPAFECTIDIKKCIDRLSVIKKLKFDIF